MVPSPTDRFDASRAPGARTGIGTYINYLLAAGMLAAAAVSAALVRGKRVTPSAPAPTSTETPPTPPEREETT